MSTSQSTFNWCQKSEIKIYFLQLFTGKPDFIILLGGWELGAGESWSTHRKPNTWPQIISCANAKDGTQATVEVSQSINH